MGLIPDAKYTRSAFIALLTAVLAGAALWSLMPPGTPAVESVDILRIGVLPDQNADVLMQKYSPLAEYLSEQTGTEIRLIIPSDYQDLLRLFGEGQIDLAYFGGLTFVQAKSLYGALPLVMREIDTRFTSLILVRAEHAHLEMKDFRGRKMSFGSKLSTSGHLMPRHFLKQQWNIEPEQFFSEIRYSGAHDKTAMLVRDGDVDLGVANASIFNNMIEDGRLTATDLHVLWQTPPYPDYVWAVTDTLGEAMTTRLRDAFLRLDAADPARAELMAGLAAQTFLPAHPDEFATLIQIASTLSLTEL